MTSERRRHAMHAVRNATKNGGSSTKFASASFFLVLSMVACFGVSPVRSSPSDDFAGWFSKGDTQTNDGSLPPPPGVTSSQKKLQKCVFTNVLAIDEEDSSILLNETLMVDGCLLECDNKIIHSTVKEGSIVTVRNGGHVKNCNVALVKDEELEEDLANIEILDKIFDGEEEDDTSSGTVAPSVWDTETEVRTKLARYYPFPVAGFLCDQGDCLLENSSCSSREFDPSDPPINMLILRECVYVQVGATDVRVEGGLVTEENRPISLYGIAVDAGFNPAPDTSLENDDAKARLFVDNVTIRNQLKSGIIVLGGVKTIRITNSIISNNAAQGMRVYAYDLAFFSVLGGSIEDNGMCGILVNDNKLTAPPTKTQMMISDVLLKNNGKDGLKMVRGIDDILIDGAIFGGNGLNGIDIWSAATITLQGVVSKNNAFNGLSVEAPDSIVEIANSLFLHNGMNIQLLKQPWKQPWKQSGIYMWLPKRVTITNSVSNGNSMDGIIIWDVTDLKFTDVDVMRNGNDGIEIRETKSEYVDEYTTTSDYLVGAYYYPWHGANFHNDGGYLRKELTPPQSPTLGEYDDSDPDVINKHLEWFRKSNIGLLVTSWWGPNPRVEDTNTLKILDHDSIGNVKIALHYETTGRIKEEDGDAMSVVESDIEYMCENYFDHPNYYKINNRPVLVVYISRKLEQLGTLESALLTMRSRASKCNQNIYLIGDAVFAKAPEVNDEEPFVSFRYFDAVTNYDVYGSSGASKRDSPYAGTESVDNYYAEQEKWRELALKENCRYIPPVSPGYNDRAVRFEKDHPPLSRRLTESSEEGSMFKYQLEKALPLVDPDLDNLILVNSFNEWHEDTQIEPVGAIDITTDSLDIATAPEKFTGGLEYVGYGELYLDILGNATTTRIVNEQEPERSYVPTNVDFTDVRTCNNGANGMRFYVTDNSFDDQTEFVFNTGPGVISCENDKFDYEMYGNGNVDFFASPADGIVGDKCANGKEVVGCEYQSLMKSCKKSFCNHRDIVTTGGGVINEHKIE